MLETVAWGSLGVAFVCAVVMVVDLLRRPQAMGIMNVVWPITALYSSVFALLFYFRFGRAKAGGEKPRMSGPEHDRMMEAMKRSPGAVQIALASSHCGAGCTLGDIVAEFAVFGLGWSLWGSPLWASFVADFVLAWALGIVFQYFTLAPMRGLSFGAGVWAAIKADTLSITAWQIGMYGWMALSHFVLFSKHPLEPNQAGYWLMMQVAMIGGFATAYPMNYLLVKTGVKEPMMH
ncbi:DUF4396 domain-containing protein [Granulicella sp. 5B5]|uniref:DUF4396 domain-containing protein n=1 Tax=Granulicella sp. 5B5 TaxID=1617967 RepID=UPI0015F6ED21|nr:DUF4396 domain-containing protein [Granulicella sp. 5B5]QMV19079.1 DUF4396 domain-containing protein [Granulicella sp. 5B5]